MKMIRLSIAVLTLFVAFSANAQSRAALACLQHHDPVIRNVDGSLSPNPNFDRCLKAPISDRAPPQRPHTAAVASSQPLPAPGPPVTPPLTSGDVVHPVSASSLRGLPPAVVSAPVKPAPLPKTAPAVVASAAKPTWKAVGGSDTLRSAVEQWAKRAGWTVIWDAGIDYPIVGSLKYEGTYLDAVRGIFLAHAGAERPLRADAYTRQQLIHITE